MDGQTDTGVRTMEIPPVFYKPKKGGRSFQREESFLDDNVLILQKWAESSDLCILVKKIGHRATQRAHVVAFEK